MSALVVLEVLPAAGVLAVLIYGLAVAYHVRRYGG